MGCGSSSSAPADGGTLPRTEPDEKANSIRSINPTLPADGDEGTKDASEFDLKRTVDLDATVEKTWEIASDWSLNYLTKYDESVKVVTSTDDATGCQMRTVTLQTGQITEKLVSQDNNEKTLVYEMVESFLPYSSHRVEIKVEAHELASKSVLKWLSTAVASEDLEKTKRLAEKGLSGAFAVFRKAVEGDSTMMKKGMAAT